MLRYVWARLLDAVPTVFLVLTLVFVAMRLLPGDPALVALGESAEPAQLALFRTKMGLDDPYWLQYVKFIWDMLRGHFGHSLMSGTSVSELIIDNMPYTIHLTIMSVFLGLLAGVPLGVLAGTKPNKLPDDAVRLFALMGYAIPDFFLAAVLLIVFALNLGWFPISGAGEGFWDVLYHLILPSITLALLKSAFVARLSRTSLLEVMGRDYIRTARAKGAAEGRVVYLHGLRNALLPLSTGIGLSILATLSGSVAVELVFDRPGIGRLLVEAIRQRDYPVIQAGVVLLAFMVVLINLAIDLLYVVIDPRVRVKS